MEQLRAQRAKERAKLTKLTNELVQAYSLKDDADTDELAFLAHQIEKQEAVLEKIYAELIEHEVDEPSDHLDKAYEARFKATRLVSRLEARDKSDASSGEEKSIKTAYVLPRLSLPSFDGDYLQWRPFWDQFEAAVDSRPLEASQKFAFLRSCLLKEAREAISGLSATTKNYESAKSTLKRRYGNPNLLVGLYCRRVLNLPTVRDGDTKGFRSMYDAFESSYREIKNIMMEMAETDATAALPAPAPSTDHTVSHVLLSSILLEKLPEAVNIEWSRQNGGGKQFNLEELLKFVAGEVESREVLERCRDGDRSVGGRDSKVDGSSRKPVRERSTMAGNAQARCSISDLPEGKRLSAVRERNLCRNCLGRGHRAVECRSQYRCKECRGRHHSCLHAEMASTARSNSPRSERNRSPGTGESVRSDQANESMQNTTVNTSTSGPALTRSMLQTAVVWASRPGYTGGTFARLLLDSGSEETYMSERLRKELGLPVIQRHHFSSETFGGQSLKSRVHDRVQIALRGRQPDAQLYLVKAWTVERICNPVFPPRIDRSKLAGLTQTSLAETFENSGRGLEIDMLLGADCLAKIVLPEAPICASPSLMLIPTVFGWTVIGGGGGPASSSRSLLSFTRRVDDLWTLESMGISPEESDTELKVLPAPILENERYTVALPWKGKSRPSFNRKQAEVRLRSYERLPTQRKEVYEAYLRSLEQEGIIEEGDQDGYFLPHHGVWRGEKLRVVFDGSCRSLPAQRSINDCLETGPNLVRPLVSVLIGFRIPRNVVTADVRAAFHQIQVDDADRKYLQLLWKRNGELTFSRFARVPFGLNSSPYLLQRVVLHHLSTLESEHPVAVETIRRGLYVDDVVLGRDTAGEMPSLALEVAEIFRKAGMELHKWRIGGRDVDPDDFVDWSMDPGEVLGITWTPRTDLISLDLSVVFKREIHTKRDLLAASARLWDPLGLAFPWSVRIRSLFQDQWRPSVASDGDPRGWDDPLCPEVTQELQRLRLELITEPQLRVPRMTGEPRWLDVFVDASPRAYCCACYGSTEHTSCLLFAKTRLAPIKPCLSLPRLELMAAVLGVRVYRFLVEICPAFSGLPIRFWSDSSITLSWIRGPPEKWKVFVRNRVQEVSDLGRFWNKVASEDNAADLGTRGVPFSALVSSEIWWHGPEFIRVPPEPPNGDDILDLSEREAEQMEMEARVISHHCLLSVGLDGEPLSHIGSLTRAEHVMAWVLRFVQNIRYRAGVHGDIRLDELCSARLALIRQCQLFHYGKEYKALARGEQLKHTRLHAYRPRLEDGILVGFPRNGERLLPIIPADSHLASLLVVQAHRLTGHQGVPSTLAEVQRAYWIPKLRGRVKKLIFACVPCRKLQARSFNVPEAGLPEFRREPRRPFSHVGVDHCGPFYLRGGEKCWILLITCGSTRAVHLEVVPSLDREHTLNALRRFQARRGPVEFVVSDNGRAFKQLSRTLYELKWKTIPEASPWWGGFYERMVGTVKRSLKKVIGRASLSLDSFSTVVAEVETTVNRRPLTVVEGDAGEPLTPLHFILGAIPPPLLPSPVWHPATCDWSLGKRWRALIALSDQFWKRWTSEYLPTLRNWRWRSVSSRGPKVGEVVLVEADAPRNQWPLGLITGLIRGGDGVVRAVELRVRGTNVRRPVQKIYPLEVSGQGGEDVKLSL